MAGGLVVHDPAKVDLGDLAFAPYNPRTITNKELTEIKASLETYGLALNLVVQRQADDGTPNVLIGGHQRVRAARELCTEKGWPMPDHGWAVYFDVDDREAMQINLALNNTGGDFDKDKVRAVVRKIGKVKPLRAKAMGYTMKDLERLRGKKAKAKPETAGGHHKPMNPKTKEGDIYELGRHLLWCGDSLGKEVEEVLEHFGSTGVDMVLTDPPYAIYGSSTGIGADIADDAMVRPFFREVFRIIRLALKDFGHAYVHCDWRSWASLWEAASSAAMSPKNCLIWDKGGGGLGSMWAHGHEFVGFFVREPPMKAMISNQRRGQRTVYRENVLRYPRVTGKDRQHNAAKPVAMLLELLEAGSDEGARVLDLFGGSGSVMIACERSARKCLTIDKDPGWCDVIVERWERETGKTARLKT